jgi:4,5-DOPA dioxygenase extradiol
MERKHFIKVIAGGALMMSLQGFRKFTEELTAGEALMPVLFVGHGSPMNAIEDNEFTLRWKEMGKQIPVPKAVVIVSAHWLTKGTHVTAMEHPKTIHDFGGFPKSLFDVEYPAPGSPAIAQETASLIKSTNVGMDHDWGLDHGAWSVVKQMYPQANIPMIQLSIDYHQSPQYHYDLAKQLMGLRKKGVLILASGNMVHNLGMIQFPKNAGSDPFSAEYGFDWTLELNKIFKDKIAHGDHKALINYEQLHKAAKLGIPTPDHYYPLLYAMALQDKKDDISFFNDKAVGGSLTMTSVKIG